MSDLIAAKGFENSSTPFTLKEHQVEWRDPQRRYLDFDIGNNYNKTCKYPRFWLESGYPIGREFTDQMKGCYDSDFDQVSTQTSQLSLPLSHYLSLVRRH